MGVTRRNFLTPRAKTSMIPPGPRMENKFSSPWEKARAISYTLWTLITESRCDSTIQSIPADEATGQATISSPSTRVVPLCMMYLMNTEGQELQQVSQSGTNAQGASLSPDGKWIAFTGYTNVADKDQNSCEIFIMRVDGSQIRQLTNNTYCDYQPRWGN